MIRCSIKCHLFSFSFFFFVKQKAARLHIRILAAQWKFHARLAIDLLWKSSMGVVRRAHLVGGVVRRERSDEIQARSCLLGAIGGRFQETPPVYFHDGTWLEKFNSRHFARSWGKAQFDETFLLENRCSWITRNSNWFIHKINESLQACQWVSSVYSRVVTKQTRSPGVFLLGLLQKQNEQTKMVIIYTCGCFTGKWAHQIMDCSQRPKPGNRKKSWHDNKKWRTLEFDSCSKRNGGHIGQI